MNEELAPTSESEGRLVREEQVRVAFGQTGQAVVGGAFVSGLLAWILVGAVDSLTIMRWLSSLLVLLSIRGVLYLLYRRRSPGDDPAVWHKRLVAVAFVYGCAWGSAWWIFLPVAGHPEYTAIIMAWMVGMGAISVSAYTMSLPTMFALFLPIIFPGILRLLLIGGTMEVCGALGLVAYVVVATTTMLPIHRGMMAAIRLNFENAREIAERKRVEAMLRELSTTDGLTGLATRRHFDEVLADELERASRTHTPIALILADVDCFKMLNDTRGHVEGDNYLKQVALAVKSVGRRPGDLAARYGGEELAVILANTGLTQAARLAETLRMSVEALQLPHRATRVENCDVVTVSVGATSLVPLPGTTPEEVISLADEALYAAKKGGRNRVEIKEA